MALVHLAKIPQPHGGSLNAGGTVGNRGGRPDLARRIRRQSITDRAMQEQLRILELSEQSPVPLLEFTDLTNTVAKYDDELRVKQTEHSFRQPLVVRVVSEDE